MNEFGSVRLLAARVCAAPALHQESGEKTVPNGLARSRERHTKRKPSKPGRPRERFKTKKAGARSTFARRSSSSTEMVSAERERERGRQNKRTILPRRRNWSIPPPPVRGPICDAEGNCNRIRPLANQFLQFRQTKQNPTQNGGAVRRCVEGGPPPGGGELKNRIQRIRRRRDRSTDAHDCSRCVLLGCCC